MSSTRKYFTGDANAFEGFTEQSVLDASSREVYVGIMKELLYQKALSSFLQSKKASLASNNEVIAKEAALCSAETAEISGKNDRMKTLSEQLKAKEEEAKRHIEEDKKARDERPSVQELFAEDLTSIQTRLDAHSAKSKALIDENNALRSEFRDLLKVHDESDHVVVERLKLVDELFRQAILKQENFKMRREKQGEISDLYMEDIKKYQGNEKVMKQQLDEFSKRFSEFESELNSSSAVFASHKKQIDDLQEVISGLESEKIGLAATYATAVMEMREVDGGKSSRTQMVDNAQKLVKQIALLDKLITTLQQQKVQFAGVEHQVAGALLEGAVEEAGSASA
jgi:archaellum component FlaC